MTWGGVREGAGRKASSALGSHLARPDLSLARRPVAITLKLRSSHRQLRSLSFFKTFHRASLRARRFGLHIIEFSIEKVQIRLICEITQNNELESGLKSLTTSLAIAAKKRFEARHKREHKGPVFLGRFRLELLKNSQMYREKLKSFFLASSAGDLLLRRKILGSYPKIRQRIQKLLSFSSATLFHSWKRLLDPGEPDIDWQRWPDPQCDSETHRSATEITATPRFYISSIGWKSAQHSPCA